MIIIYYDKNLKTSKENISNFTILRRTFYGNEIYGIDTFEKFKYLLSLFKKTSQNFYLISSGSSTKEFLDSGYYDECKNRIIDFLIYTANRNAYLPLMKTTKVSFVEDKSFQNVIEYIKKKEPLIVNDNEYMKHYSSFLLVKEYLESPLETQKKIMSFFDVNYKTPSFNESIKKKILDILNKIAPTKFFFEDAKNMIDKVKSEADIIRCYTTESILYVFLNKSLREVDKSFIEFAGLLNYALYKYYHDNSQIKIKTDMTFYRKITFSMKDLYAYDLFEGKIICFPAFTTISNDMNSFSFPVATQKKSPGFGAMLPGMAQKTTSQEKCVLFKISYKYNSSHECPCFNIKKFSGFKVGDEYIFPPFSFFRILKCNMNAGTPEDPIVIDLEVVPKCFDFEKNLKKGGKVTYDQNTKCVICK